MSHHGSPDYMRRLIEEATGERPGPTGQFPRGKLQADDDGEIKIGIAADPKKGVVIIDFGAPVTWIGFTADQAIDIAEMLHAKAREARGISEM